MGLRRIKAEIRKVIGLRNDTDFYAQGGEDAILLCVANQLLNTPRGFYIDIGAYHPFKHSNTYLLYRSGWKGVNIDPRPGSKALFDRYRPRDLNIEAGIGGADKTLTYYYLGERSTMNTFSRENLEKLGMVGRIKKEIPVPVYTFNTLLDKFNIKTAIDYLNIDAEGFEMEILAGIPFERVAPRVISIEQNGVFSIQDVQLSDVCQFLGKHGYIPFAKNFILKSVATVFYFRD